MAGKIRKKRKLKIVSVVGARPQFIKVAPLTLALRRQHQDILVHTGQHYDHEMSQLFFDELGIPRPDYNLGVGSGEHGVQTGRMLIALEKILMDEKPDLILVYGDTNSTLAGALAAAKLHIPCAHIEAGMRSFNRRMPEEINRILTDRISELLFCSTRQAAKWLREESLTKGVHFVGDIMYDAVLKNKKIAEKSKILKKLKLKPRQYLLATIHRAENTDNKERFKSIIEALIESGEQILFPVHPRALKQLKLYGLHHLVEESKNVRLTDPVGYLEMLKLEKNAKKILTDSGGIQKEAYFLKVPCITVRDETEWVETVKDGWNVLVGASKNKILKAINKFRPRGQQHRYFGDGKSRYKIIEVINRYFA